VQIAPVAAPTTDGLFQKASIRRLNWMLLSVVCLALDYLSGPDIQFPFFYLAPVSLAAWYDGRAWGLLLAAVLPLMRFSFRMVWDSPPTFWVAVANAGIRITVFVAFVWLIARMADQVHQLRHTRQLEAILGVCSVCGKIHDQVVDAWQPIDQYLSSHKTEFEQELCPACRQQFKETFDRR